MKALACGNCGDVRGLLTAKAPDGLTDRHAEHPWVSCACGYVEARWSDPVKGTAEFRGVYKYAFLLGLNNHFLGPALRGETAIFADARALHAKATIAPDHIFDKSRAACWAVIVKPGQSTDVEWVVED